METASKSELFLPIESKYQQDISDGTFKGNYRILIIDDNEAIHEDFREILGGSDNNKIDVSQDEAVLFGISPQLPEQEHFEIDFAFQGEEGLEKVQQALAEGRPYTVAFVDIRMPPGWDGVKTIQRIWREYPQLQVVICTAYSDYRWIDFIEQFGRTDKLLILKKPFDVIEVQQMACSIVKKRDILNHMENLHKEQEKEILDTQETAFFALAELAESHFSEIGGHLENIRVYSMILAEQLAKENHYKKQITEQFLKDIFQSSPIHDIGKVSTPDAVLLKPGKFSQDEFEIMKRHTIVGEKTIRNIAEVCRTGSMLSMALEITRSHHERFDGSGYPDGLRGMDIPLSARIVALADVYDALTSDRVYKKALDPYLARSMILDDQSKHFDPAVLEAFCACWDDFLAIRGLVNNSSLELVGAG